MTKVNLHLSGLSCAGCAGRAERALTALPGLSHASVNFATGTAHMDLDMASLDTVTTALDAAGYPAQTATTTLRVQGLHCASCTGRVEQLLSAVPGVQTASVNLATETASVTYLTGATSPSDLSRIVTQGGYPTRPAQADDPNADSHRRAQETAQARHATLFAAALTLPVFITEMGGHMIPALHHWLHTTLGHSTLWLGQFLLTTLVIIGPGRKFYTIGLPALLRGAPDMNSLVALGTLAAWGYSTVALFQPALLPAGTVAVYFEAAAVIITLVLLGRWLEARARGQTGAAIRRLMGLQPNTARVFRGDQPQDIPIEDVAVGDRVLLRPGERVPVDGRITNGQSRIDEAMITGEPIPTAKSPGDVVIAGTINTTNTLTMTATGVGQDTMLARIVEMVQKAQGAKLPIQALADKVVLLFVPAVIAIALLTAAFWAVFGPPPALGLALVAAVSVLIIACPCAMGLATPTSIMVGTGRAAELGVLFRKGDALQQLSDVAVVAFDKTGTLTLGAPSVTHIETRPGVEADEILARVAAAQAQSEHPIAHAIEQAAQDRALVLPQAKTVRALAGLGLAATVDGHDLLIGTARLMEQHGCDATSFADALDKVAARGETPVLVAEDKHVVTLFSVSDPIKPSAKETIARLHQNGIKTALITGDTPATAQTIATDLGIEIVHASVMPGDKRDLIADMQATHGPVAFVGDGINDAPALAQSDVGIAMGTGTDVAIETADVVLVSGAPSGVVTAREISHSTLRNIKQNLFWAFAYNTALIPVAAGVLYPITGTLLSPMLAAGAMALSSVFVLTNALRLRAHSGGQTA